MRALVERRPASLPELEIQFGDYLAWLDDRLEDPEIGAQIDYWSGKLQGYQAPRSASLITHGHRGPCLDSDIVSRTLPDSTDRSAQDPCATSWAGRCFTTGLAAAMALLWRETGGNDICDRHARRRPQSAELEKLVGPLVNYVVIRADADGDMSFRALEAAVRESMLELFANQDVPFERVIDALQARGQVPPEPFYSISFVAHRAFAGGRNFTSTSGGVTLRTIPSKSQGALYDLFFFLVERENGWRLSLDYRTELFQRRTCRAPGRRSDRRPGAHR